MRKELISNLKETIENITSEEIIPHSAKVLVGKMRKWIAWLEKQGEPTYIPADAVLDSNKDGLIADTIRYKREKQGEQKPAEEYNITGIGSKNAQGKLGEMIKKLKKVNNN